MGLRLRFQQNQICKVSRWVPNTKNATNGNVASIIYGTHVLAFDKKMMHADRATPLYSVNMNTLIEVDTDRFLRACSGDRILNSFLGKSQLRQIMPSTKMIPAMHTAQNDGTIKEKR